MKADISQSNISQLTLDSQKIEGLLIEQKVIYCPSNNISTQVCLNKACQNNAFICDSDKCQCLQKHSECFTLNLKKFFQIIESKRISTEFLENFIEVKIQELIDSISKFHDQTKNWIKNQLQFLGLNKNEKDFLDKVQKSEFQAIKGQKIWQIIQPKEQTTSLNEFIDQNLQILSNHVKDAQISLNQNLNKIKNQILTYEQKIIQGNRSILYDLSHSKQKSKILTQKYEQKTMKQFFYPRKIKSAKILYRASENNFEVIQFHEKCKGIANTLILVETQFGKKIGGFTSIKWQSTDGYMDDESMTSFLFSLTNSDKFEMEKKWNAILINQNYGPIFGEGHDLLIYDKSNVNFSQANINKTYINQKYQQKNQQSWKKFSGDSTYSFKIKQWQVWALQFC